MAGLSLIQIMSKRIHVTGASGAGTTTLGENLARALISTLIIRRREAGRFSAGRPPLQKGPAQKHIHIVALHTRIRVVDDAA